MSLAQPATNVVSRVDLLGAFSQFDMTGEGFVSNLVLPTLEASARFGTVGIIPRKAWLQSLGQLAKRAPKGASARTEWSPSSQNFSVVEYSVEEPIDDTEQDMVVNFFNLEEIATIRLARQVATAVELDTAAAVFNDTTFPASGDTGATVGTAWTSGTATPLADIRAGINALLNSGVVPNTFICPYVTWLLLGSITEVRNAIGTSNQTSAILTDEAFKAAMGLPSNFNIIKPFAVYNTANEAAAVSASQIWNKNRAMLTYVNASPDFQSPQLGRTIIRPGNQTAQIDTYREEQTKSTVVRAARHLQPLVFTGAPAYMLRGIN